MMRALSNLLAAIALAAPPAFAAPAALKRHGQRRRARRPDGRMPTRPSASTPKYPARLQGVRLGQPRCAQGRHDVPRQSGPAHQLRQVQPVYAQGQCAHGHADPHVRAARRAQSRRRAAGRCTAWSPKKCWSRRTSSSITFRINPKARFNNGDPGARGGREALLDMLMSKGAAPSVRAVARGVSKAPRWSANAYGARRPRGQDARTRSST